MGSNNCVSYNRHYVKWGILKHVLEIGSMNEKKTDINPLDKPVFVYLPVLVAVLFGLVTGGYFILKIIFRF